MGIFGYLSRAHIDQQLKINTGVTSDIQIINNQIKTKEDSINDINKQISFIDDSISKMIEKGKTKDSLSATDKQRKTRDELVSKRDREVAELNTIKTKKIQAEAESKKIEAEIGPLKYVAEFFYGESSEKVVDKAVTYVIIIIILVFDPLAIFLLIAFNQTLAKNKDEYDIEFFEYKPRKKRKYRR
jgi:hypothetical protein